MDVFTLYKKPENVVKEFLLPILIQLLLVSATVIPHRLFVGRGEFVVPAFQLGDLANSPTSGRLAYVFVAFVLFLTFAIISSKLAGKEKITSSFYTGVLAGTFLWQFLGEDIWHFGCSEGGEMIYFLRMESVQVFPLVIVALLLVGYAVKRDAFDWGVFVIIFTFLVNWIGHYVSEGTYAFVDGSFTMGGWISLTGFILGPILLLGGTYLGVFGSKNQKGRMLASMLVYMSFGQIGFAFIY